MEELSDSSGDVVDIRTGAGTRLPIGLSDDIVYTFDPPLRAPQVRALLEEGQRLAGVERDRRGLGPPPPAAGIGTLAAGGPLPSSSAGQTRVASGAVRRDGGEARDALDTGVATIIEGEEEEEVVSAIAGSALERIPLLSDSGRAPWMAAEDARDAKIFFGDRLPIGGRKDAARILSRHGRWAIVQVICGEQIFAILVEDGEEDAVACAADSCRPRSAPSRLGRRDGGLPHGRAQRLPHLHATHHAVMHDIFGEGRRSPASP